MDTIFNIFKEELKSTINLYSRQHIIVGTLAKYRFNHLDLGILMQAALLSLYKDFDEGNLAYNGCQIRLLKSINEIVFDTGSSTLALKNTESLRSLTYEVSLGYHKYILYDESDKNVHEGDFYKNVKNKDDKNIFLKLSKNNKALSRAFKLGLKVKLEMSDAQIGIIIAALSQSSLESNYIQAHKDEKYLRRSLLSLSSMYSDL